MAKIDVVVPCYNYGRFLKACVRSILNQSVKDVRVLIIDDASSDNSALVAQKLAADDSRVEVSLHLQNRGHIETYNEGIEWADSDYFMLLSADDLLIPGAFERATGILDREPHVVLTYGRGIEWQDTLPFPAVETEQSHAWTRQNLVRDMCAVGTNLVTTPTAIGRTDVQKSIGGYRATLPHSADMEMWLRFGARGDVARIEAVQAVYRKHSSNMSGAYYGADWGDYWHRKAAFDSFFEADKNIMPEFESLRARTSQSLAEHALATGASLLRSGIRRSERARITHGIELLRLSTRLNPKLSYTHLLGELLRLPEPVAHGWPVSTMRQAVGKLRGRMQRI
jgi:glycosyltransferase involved in cell wall biosynthesis